MYFVGNLGCPVYALVIFEIPPRQNKRKIITIQYLYIILNRGSLKV
jgi:hypothetical protein